MKLVFILFHTLVLTSLRNLLHQTSEHHANHVDESLGPYSLDETLSHIDTHPLYSSFFPAIDKRSVIQSSIDPHLAAFEQSTQFQNESNASSSNSKDFAQFLPVPDRFEIVSDCEEEDEDQHQSQRQALASSEVEGIITNTAEHAEINEQFVHSENQSEKMHVNIDEVIRQESLENTADDLISFANDGNPVFAEFLQDHGEVMADVLKDRFYELQHTDYGIDALQQLIMKRIPILEARLCFNLKEKGIWAQVLLHRKNKQYVFGETFFKYAVSIERAQEALKIVFQQFKVPLKYYDHPEKALEKSICESSNFPWFQKVFDNHNRKFQLPNPIVPGKLGADCLIELAHSKAFSFVMDCIKHHLDKMEKLLHHRYFELTDTFEGKCCLVSFIQISHPRKQRNVYWNLTQKGCWESTLRDLNFAKSVISSGDKYYVKRAVCVILRMLENEGLAFDDYGQTGIDLKAAIFEKALHCESLRNLLDEICIEWIRERL